MGSSVNCTIKEKSVNRTGPKEKEGADYCWEEARGITRAYNGQERPD